MGRPVSLQVDIRQRLGGFSLQVAFTGAPDGVTALFGPSGAGKSAVLAAVAGATRPDDGRIALGDETLFDSQSRVNLPVERRGVGWVFQDARLFPHLSVEANLRYGETRARGRPQVARFAEVVEVLGIGHLLARRPVALSGGERQRVAIGRALLSQPRILLMDEPLSALDAARKAEILPFLERLKSSFSLPILYVSHSLTEVARLADRLVVMEQGRVLAEGPLADLVVRGDLTSLVGRPDAAAVLDLSVAGHDPVRGLTTLAAGGVEILVPLLDRPPGAAARLSVMARDVLIARQAPGLISARNILKTTVEAVTPRPGGGALVTLALAPGLHLLSAITQDAAQMLALSPGDGVWAVVKSVAVEGLGAAALRTFDD
jgi:molybdate transport system ATP-binding protein